MFGSIPQYGIHRNGRRFIPPEIIGAAFSLAMENGTYNTSTTSIDETQILEGILQRPDKALLTDMKTEPMNGFAWNENYATVELFYSLSSHRDRVFGIYGAEDGLYDRPQQDALKKLLPEGHFRIVQNASHAIFINQRDELIDFATKSLSQSSAKSCAAIFAR